jgi:dihydrodipicolinate synthase/N-acetylneuraminate lyase
LLPFIEAIFEEPSPGPVKYLLSESWENVGKPLLPMTDVSPELAKKLNDQYSKINI